MKLKMSGSLHADEDGDDGGNCDADEDDDDGGFCDADDGGDALDNGCCKASSVKPTIVAAAALSHQGFGPWSLRCNTISDILQYCINIPYCLHWMVLNIYCIWSITPER